MEQEDEDEKNIWMDVRSDASVRHTRLRCSVSRLCCRITNCNGNIVFQQQLKH